MNANPFQRFRPVHPDYARLPILEAFNWSECLADVEIGQWYVVAFRSIRSNTADSLLLQTLDDRAYAEAQREPGLLLYFRGCLNERRECLSVCVWESQEQARAATGLPSHRAAADITDQTYELFDLERWLLTKRSGATRLELTPIKVADDRASRYASAVTQQGGRLWMPPGGIEPGLQMDGQQPTFG